MSSRQPLASPSVQGRQEGQGEAILAELLSSRVRAALLAWFVAHLDGAYSLTDISRDTGIAVSSLQHECYKLERIDILKSNRDGQSRLYRFRLDSHHARAIVNLTTAIIGFETVIDQIAQQGGTFHAVALALPPQSAGRPVLILIGAAGLEALSRIVSMTELLLGVGRGEIELAYAGPTDASALQRILSRVASCTIQPISGVWPPAVSS